MYPGLPANKPLEAEYSEKLEVGYRWYDSHRVRVCARRARRIPRECRFGVRARVGVPSVPVRAWFVVHFVQLHGACYRGARCELHGHEHGQLGGRGGTGRVTLSWRQLEGAMRWMSVCVCVCVHHPVRIVRQVSQLYIGFPDGAAEPPMQLRGFVKVQLAPGASASVGFSLTQKVRAGCASIRGWLVMRLCTCVRTGRTRSSCGACCAPHRTSPSGISLYTRGFHSTASSACLLAPPRVTSGCLEEWLCESAMLPALCGSVCVAGTVCL